mgnify:CR=1 FL=1
MNKNEFNKLKTGDTVYSVSPLSSVYYKVYVLSKGVDTISFIDNGDVFRAKYSQVFTSEEKARQEIIRRIKDSIMTKVSSVRHLMVNLYTVDSTSLDDGFISKIVDSINGEYEKLKEINNITRHLKPR